MVGYEWIVETMDGDDVVDVSHWETFGEARADAQRTQERGETVEIGLVRDRIDEVDGNLEDRQWAYLGWLEDGKLPEQFDGGAQVPKRFHREVEALEVMV